MEMTTNGMRINVEALRSRLLQPRIIMERFSLPATEEEAHLSFLAAVEGEVRNRRQEFKLTPHVELQVRRMAQWLIDDNSTVGMILCGGTGTGKTTFLKALQQLLNHLDLKSERFQGPWKLTIVDAVELVDLSIENPKKFETLCFCPMLAIDDLGTEPLETEQFRNIRTPVIQLLNTRYSKQLFTLVTTNLTPQQLRLKYGDRTASRFSDMMELLVFDNSDYRIIKK